jgi:hypothetical protein
MLTSCLGECGEGTLLVFHARQRRQAILRTAGAARSSRSPQAVQKRRVPTRAMAVGGGVGNGGKRGGQCEGGLVLEDAPGLEGLNRFWYHGAGHGWVLDRSYHGS